MALFIVIWLLLVLACWRLAAYWMIPNYVGVELARAIVVLAPMCVVLIIAKPVARWLRNRSGE
jgi:hypothetical protein